MRYIIGIDLGTTNSCVAYIDTQNPRLSIQSFRIPQLSRPGMVEALPTLPSFCYLCAPYEWPTGALNLPWKEQSDFTVGSFAQAQGAKVPTRLVQSAKSWLCHSAVDRRSKLLPFEAADEERKISPLEATTRYLRHIKEAWNSVIAQGVPEAEFEEQEIVLTVPASFDEVARALTAEAAKQAGFVHMTLLEEPQAAFYSWISQHEQNWESQFEPGQTILVCDVGGGTTDFSLIEVNEKDGKRGLNRMAVGDHLLLGGDNMDAAIARYFEKELERNGYPECSTTQWLQLCHAARNTKETLFSDGQPEDSVCRVLLQGSGSSVVQGSMAVEARREVIKEILADGFFGIYPWEEALQLRKAAGFRAMGLPYEDDPSITKHLAFFLNQAASGREKGVKCPDFVLFNGGAMKPAIFQEAIVNSLKNWFPGKEIGTLSTVSLDLAVARGAAYYGKVRRGLGVRIGGGTARGYYLEVESQGQRKALTLLPRGAEEWEKYEPDRLFLLKPNIPVSFHLYTSHVRLHDLQGDLVDIDPQEMHLLPPINTVLRYGKKQPQPDDSQKIPVHVQISLTAIGTLELWLKSIRTDHRWSLEFQLRTAAGQDNSISLIGDVRQDETYDASYLREAEKVIEECFSPTGSVKPGKMMEELEKTLQSPRREWPPSVLRGLWPALLKASSYRKTSPDLDARWWNLAGFILRPGFGYPLDDFRVKELWKIILGDLKSPKALESQIQNWICYRRIAGGLNKGQQIQLASEILPLVLNKKSNRIEIKGKGEIYQHGEKIRALAAFELIDSSLKIRLGQAILQRILEGEAVGAEYWALGRIGARRLVHGSAAHVVPRECCTTWIEALIDSRSAEQDNVLFVVEQLGRKTDYREINLAQGTIQKVLNHYAAHPCFERLQDMLLHESRLSVAEQEQVFGENLPVGLSFEDA